MKSNYNKFPYVEVKNVGEDDSFEDIKEIIRVLEKHIKNGVKTIVMDFYPGVIVEDVKNDLISKLNADIEIFSDDEIFEDNETITNRIAYLMTDDRVFGKMNNHMLEDFVIAENLKKAQEKVLNSNGLVIVYGVGASLVTKGEIYLYFDMARWEIQLRYRSALIPNWKYDNYVDDALKKYKRGYFFEWRIADRHKRDNFDNFDYVVDTNKRGEYRMISGNAFRKGLVEATRRPIRVVPFFDPGVWGGQWMKEVCDLDRSQKNFAWCFDCVPEEESLLLKVNDVMVEIPSQDVCLYKPIDFMGIQNYQRFAFDFPIRFDFLDTIKGQNLSLQVHPIFDYIKDKFGMAYTQEESYYILDTDEENDKNYVYLGLKNNVNPEEMIDELRKAARGEKRFEDEKFVNKFEAHKHDHFLIPPGTIHCSGAGTMVLEISTNAYIFTFKLWDWGRLGLDGLPRPLNVEHGKYNIQFYRDTDFCKRELVNNISIIKEEEGNKEEKTGLHELEFIETRRNWFSKPVLHKTYGEVNVLNLVEGREALVTSPKNEFEPFVVHYAETFIVPAGVDEYIIQPYGESEGEKIATLKAFVRNTAIYSSFKNNL